jgi:ABC-type sugar transport system ATPase subunit
MTTADRMAVLDKGVVQQVGTAAALYDFPANRLWRALWARPTCWTARSRV